MSVTLKEEDVLSVLGSENRRRILRYLCDRKGYASTSEIEEKTQIKMGNVGFHCNKLADRGLVDKELVDGKLMWRITQKGLKVLEEVDKREKERNTGKKNE